MVTTSHFDVVIVGARCAGATLATFLARGGASVLLLDRDRLPSDQILSTHTIHPPGIQVLDEVGVGDAVRAVAPPTHIVRLRKNDAFVDIHFPRDRAEYCPRRKRLDGLLQDAAASAGVEVIDQTRVTSLVREKDRVLGLRAAGVAGQEREFRASLVVGADGRHSTIAREVGAEEYLAYDAPRAMFWGYWNAPAFWRTDPAYPFGMYVANTDGHIRVIFQTDHDQLLIGSLPPVEQGLAWRADPEAALSADLASDATTGPLIAGSTPDGRIRGTVKERYFFRQAAGNGWALVGDAGHHKEFVIGDGITEALLQARSLASAIAQGTDAALHRWWRARDVAALPYFFLGRDEGALGPPLELQQVVFSHVAKRPGLQARMAATMEHQLSPLETWVSCQSGAEPASTAARRGGSVRDANGEGHTRAPSRILIVGGGIAGLALARALRQHGLDSEIIERAAAWPASGTGLYLPGNGVRALGALGLADNVLARAVRMSHQRILDQAGRALAEVELSTFWGPVGPCVGIHRGDLHRVLLEGAAGVPIRLGTTLTTLSQAHDGVNVAFSDGSTGTYDLVVGADGIHSSIRQLGFGEAHLRQLGQVSWRFLVDPCDAIKTWTAMLGARRAFLAIPVGSNRLYCYADFLTAAKHDPTSRDLGRFRALFADFGEPVASILNALESFESIHFSPIEEIVVDPCVQGRVVLIGDAAHAMSPNMAEGASMALEDALVLTRMLSSHRSTVEALAAFSERRRPRIRRVRQRTHRRDRIRTLPVRFRNLALRVAWRALYERDYRPLFEEP
jgi:2-polyprenyl-6-methoxyphenol hydroxylase-like FAD-dependent oxidoreductase